MDRLQFDALSRRVARLADRRSVLHAAVFGSVAAGITVASDGNAKRKRKKKKPCKPPRRKCGKNCLAAGACCTNVDCTTAIGQVCIGNACVCPDGQVLAGNSCGAPCSPACGECQGCAAGVCIDLDDGATCTDGGVCRNKVCKPDRSLGCTVAQDSCGANGSVLCPDSSTNNLFCFVDADGDPVCGTALCTNDDTGAECAGLTGAGSIVVPCAAICVSAQNKTHMCVKPIDE
jgi:hypothetical protein